MNWYDDIKYDIPESLDCVKQEILSKIPLLERKKNLHERVIRASEFFSRQGLSSAQIQEGLDLLNNIMTEIVDIDNLIAEKDINIVGVLEARTIDMDIQANIPSRINDLEENVDGRKITFYATEPGEGSKQISPSDIWFFKTAKKLFNISANNIELS